MRAAIMIVLVLASAARADDADGSRTTSQARIIGGSVASIALGFGTGQAIEGRYWKTGWIFTLGEAAAVTGFAIALHEGGIQDPCDAACRPNKGAAALALTSMIILGGLRVWEIADAIVTPREDNERIRRLETRRAPLPFVVPATRGTGAIAGFSVGF